MNSVRPTPTSFSLRGREDELHTLRTRLQAYGADRQGGSVLLLGVKGVGKSMLLQASARLAESEIRARVYVGAAEAGVSAFESLLLARLNLTPDVDAGTRETRLRAVLSQVFDDRRVGELAALMGPRLGLNLARGPLAASANPALPSDEHLGDTELGVWRRFFAADAAADKARPLVLVLDGLHESSPSERALVEGIANAGDVLVLGAATAFPGDDRRRPSSTVMQLGPLAGPAARAFVSDRIGHCDDSDLLDELHAAVREFAGGHPGLIAEALELYEGLGVVERGPVLTTIVPEKLAGGGVAVSAEKAAEYRLYKLRPEVQQVLGWAAALGTVFWSRALVTTCRYAEGREGGAWGERATRIEQRVAQALDKAVSVGVLLRLGAGSDRTDVEYAFRGTHERAYLLDKMSSEVRAGVARAYAEYLSQSPTTHTHEDSLRSLAEAREAAGDLRRAGESFAMAADVSRARGSLSRAVELQSEAIRCFAGAPGADAELAAALEKQLDSLVATRSFELVLKVAEDLLDVSFRLVRPCSAAFALARQGRAHRELGQPQLAMRCYNDACELFRSDGDPRGEASMLDELGRLAWMEGDATRARIQLESSLAIRRALGDARLVAMSAHNLGLVARDTGDTARAADYFSEAMRLRREAGELAQASASLVAFARARVALGDASGASRALEEMAGIFHGMSDVNVLAPVRLLAGDMAALRTDWALAHGLYKEAERMATELGDRRLSAEVRAGLTRATMALDDPRAAHALALDGVSRARQWGDPLALASALRLLAEVQSLRGEQADALSASAEAEALESGAPRGFHPILSMPPTAR